MNDFMLIDLIMIFFIGAIIGSLILICFFIKNGIGQSQMRNLILAEKRKAKIQKGKTNKTVATTMTIHDKDVNKTLMTSVVSLTFTLITSAIATAIMILI